MGYWMRFSAACRIVSNAVGLPSGAESSFVLNAATTAALVAGLKYMNARKPAWLPVWPINVDLPRGRTKNDIPIHSGCDAVSGVVRYKGCHISANEERDSTMP